MRFNDHPSPNGHNGIPRSIINRYDLYDKKNRDLLAFLTYLFERLTFQDERIAIKYHGIDSLDIRLKKGQVPVTLTWLESDLGLSRKQARNYLKRVIDDGIFEAEKRAQHRAQHGLQSYTLLTLVYQEVSEQPEIDDPEKGHSKGHTYPKRIPNRFKNKKTSDHSHGEFSELAVSVLRVVGERQELVAVKHPENERPQASVPPPDSIGYQQRVCAEAYKYAADEAGFDPEVERSDFPLMTRYLKEHGIQETLLLIRWFVMSKKPEKIGCRLRYAFSEHSINTFRQAWAAMDEVDRDVEINGAQWLKYSAERRIADGRTREQCTSN